MLRQDARPQEGRNLQEFCLCVAESVSSAPLPSASCSSGFGNEEGGLDYDFVKGKPSLDSVVEDVDGAGIGHRVVDPVAVRPPGSAIFGARAHGQRAISTQRDGAAELVECVGVRALHV